MPEPVIRVENLGKLYKIGALHKKRVHDTLRDNLAAGVRSIGRHLFKRAKTMLGSESFWAVRNVSFNVKQGEVLGIIGKNGAGKSTLLKMLCRVTTPTEGRALLKGRVGSLLEVGTGFHNELTGRENIYLSGAILGMDKTYIDSKLDEIIAFSGIEQFIDTPVKRYSSGMRVRLGFAVAAHLEPEILLIDEVLAVGDILFQKKCLGKMNEITGEGRTILFVSHNMASIRSMCQTCILLDNGFIQSYGLADDIVKQYENASKETVSDNKCEKLIFSERFNAGITGCRASVIPEDNEGTNSLLIEVDIFCEMRIPNLGVGIKLRTISGSVVSRLGPGLTGNIIENALGRYTCTFSCRAIDRYLSGGEYILDISLSIPKREYIVKAEDMLMFSIPGHDIYGSGIAMTYSRAGIAPLKMSFSWKCSD